MLELSTMNQVSLIEHRRKRRPALSCSECRRRKRKCNRDHPCGHCLAWKTTCVYSQSVNSSPLRALDPRSYPLPLSLPPEPVSQERPPAENTSKTDQSRMCGAQNSRTYFAQTESSTSEIFNSARPNQDKAEEGSRVDLDAQAQRPEGAVHQNKLILRPDSECASEPRLGLYALQTTINKTRISKWSHSVAEVTEFKNGISYFKNAFGFGGSGRSASEVEPSFSQATELLGKCKAIARYMKLQRPTRNDLQYHSGLVMPSRSTADILSKAYFEHFESAYRILHAPSFWKRYQEYWQNPENASMVLQLQILLVMAIGSIVTDEERLEPGLRSKTHDWVYAAQNWLSGPLEKSQLNVSNIQLHCLCILARQTLSIAGDLIWASMGSSIHSAMQIGLHRDPKHLPMMSVLQGEIHRRLWYTVMELSIQSALDSEMHSTISLTDFDTEVPATVSDEWLDDATTDLDGDAQMRSNHHLQHRSLYGSVHLRLQIVQLLNGLSSSISYADVLTLSDKLVKAHTTSETDDPVASHSSFHANVHEYLWRRFLLNLHLPFACRASTNPLFQYSRTVCVDTAILLGKPEPSEAFDRLIAIGGGPYKHTMRYAGVAVSLELLAQTHRHRSEGALHRLATSRMVIKEALLRLLDLTTERIRHGESNVKNHVFLSMVLAEVEAVEHGLPIKSETASKSLASLRFCHDLLQSQAGLSKSPDSSQADMTNFDLEQYDVFASNFDFASFL